MPDLKAIEEAIFQVVESCVEEIAKKIDQLESMDDFQLVALWDEIHDLADRSSFSHVLNELFRHTGDDFDPPADFIRGLVRRYDAVTKQHPTDAYGRFRAIADVMDQKATAVDAIIRDRKARHATGGKNRAKRFAPAKRRAEALGPRAIREGWTGPKLYRVLTDEGFELGPSTANLWLSKLRKGEPLLDD